ncbi:MAG TPA: Stk1 family PASTA domain-containing Ser/Thr kinase [Patescibacteria group bacterium]|nr:Stk1 family PASTA domain-containing Ser/Thr kinase [Patescibacteria group bacterium]
MIGKVLGNRYEILEKIGGGGMALVYKATCRLLNRFVAVKILRAEFTEDEEFVKKFKRESQAAASLSHPNIVGIYDVGMEDNIYYIVMEYIKGQTLKDLIKQKGCIGVDFATNIAIQISSALEHAHKNHIVHRDVKSHNILIKEDNTVKVTDFGIARAVSSSTITNTGNVIGSVHYFSPEQARGGYTDEKSDIYSLGVVMYEMLTGRLPFEGESPIAVALKHIQEEPVRPVDINPRIPKSINDIILKCMDKDVNNRYNSMAEIISDLRQSLVMPNGDFVKRSKFTDENTRILKPIKADQGSAEVGTGNKNILENSGRQYNAVEEEMPKGDHKKKHTKMTALAVIGGLILALTVGGIILVLVNFFSVKEILVPDLTNLTEEQAKQALIDVGLQMEVAERVPNKDVPAGQVIMQDPKANQKNKAINPVRVTISEGPRKVVVPSLIGQSYDKVDLMLEKEGLVEGDVDQKYSEYPNGIVIEQSIVANSQVDEGTTVDYVISIGPEKFLMPNYIGKNFEQTKTDLIEKDLILGNPVYEPSSVYEKDTIITQSITPGTEVNRKSVVDFTISLGKDSSNKVPLILQVPLPEGKEQMRVVVQMVQNNIIERIHEGYHNSSESPLQIPITGEGKVLFEIYIDGVFKESVEHEFK